MLELPEVRNISSQLQNHVTGRTVMQVLPPTKQHKFCWFNGEPSDYDGVLAGKKIIGAQGFGIFAEILFEEGYKLSFNDGVNVRLLQVEKPPKDYQLMAVLDDGSALVFTVAMYGGIVLHRDNYYNEYYESSRCAVSPFKPEFAAYYDKVLNESKPGLSAKALLAAEQRFPGIGNGVLQDILFEAGIHPKRKLQTLTAADRDRLFACTVSILHKMTEKGGRDTERDLFGNPGRYLTKMSKLTWTAPCPICGGPITKEAYMGGSVYYCPACQPNH